MPSVSRNSRYWVGHSLHLAGPASSHLKWIAGKVEVRFVGAARRADTWHVRRTGPVPRKELPHPEVKVPTRLPHAMGRLNDSRSHGLRARIAHGSIPSHTFERFLPTKYRDGAVFQSPKAGEDHLPAGNVGANVGWAW